MKCESQLLQNTSVMIFVQKKGQTKITVHPIYTYITYIKLFIYATLLTLNEIK